MFIIDCFAFADLKRYFGGRFVRYQDEFSGDAWLLQVVHRFRQINKFKIDLRDVDRMQQMRQIGVMSLASIAFELI